MMRIDADCLLIDEALLDDPRTRARADRLRGGIVTDDVRTLARDELERTLTGRFTSLPHNGMATDFQPVVAFTRFAFDAADPGDGRQRQSWSGLDRLKPDARDAFAFSSMGAMSERRRTGVVCQPTHHLHTVFGCPFRCAYCNFSRLINLVLDIEDFVARLDGRLDACPEQTLFQWDNWSDTICFEPEYGAAALLIDYFARKPGRALQLYVGKSDNVEFLAGLDHRGHTSCCWSLSGRTQSTRFEPLSAPMTGRIDAMARCQSAGYPVRARLSPIIPVRGWRGEVREMLEHLFAAGVAPDVITIETIRFLDYDAIARLFDLSLLDDDFVAAMRSVAEPDPRHGCEAPEDYRAEVYRFVLDEMHRIAPDTRVAFCREQVAMWERFAAPLAEHGQRIEDYYCNCGPRSAPPGVATAAD